jgi:hypothetical protein
MALQGNLRDFSITQLLNLIHLAKKSGALQIAGSSGDVQLLFRGGEMFHASFVRQSEGIADILYKAKKITEVQRDSVLAGSNNSGDKALGLQIVNAGYVSQPDIIESLERHFSNIVRKLFTWEEGSFKFDDEYSSPTDQIPVSISLENLVIEGSRQSQKAEQLKLEIPDLNMSLAFTERPGIDLKKFSLSVEEWRVVSYINPKNTIKQIAATTKHNDQKIRQIIFSLMEAGIVKLVRPEGAPTQLDGLESAFPGVERKEQKTLVTRLINRIRSI